MSVRIIIGDAREQLKLLPSESVHCIVSSPPYWGLRDYGVDGQIGLEESPEAFVNELVLLFREARRVLRSDGTLWMNLGDSYAGSSRGGNPTEASSTLEGGQESQRASMIKRTRGQTEVGSTARDAAVTNLGRRATREASGLKQKDLIGTPWLVAFALRADGWYLRQDIIWHKPNPMPESTTDRCTKAHEYFFLLSKSERYFYDAEAIAEDASPNTNLRVAASRQGEPNAGISPKSATRETNIRAKDSFHASTTARVEKRNKRSVWTVATQAFSEAHFATFPPALIEPSIMAGTSERGCCERCGVGWQRVTINVETGKTQKMPDGMATYAGGHSAIHKDGREKGASDNPVMARETIGWYPACDHDLLPKLPPYPDKPSRAALGNEQAYKAAMTTWRAACRVVDDKRRMLCERAAPLKTVPAVVLDPFGGAGTTGLVADRLQRNAILIELNPEYAAMARRRIDGDSPLFAKAAE